MKVERIAVALGGRGYDVLVGLGLLDLLDDLLPGARWRKAMVVTDGNVGPMYAGRVSAGLGRLGVEVETVTVEAGEGSKDLQHAASLYERMAAFGLTRSDAVVALGGGVVGDLAGYAAGTFKRGLDVVQLPSTLVAQVDSSIGGKTAVDLPAGKNLVGVFHQPAVVVCDVVALSTLPARELAGGIAEVVKYSLIAPDGWPEGLAEGIAALDPDDLVATVSRCAGIKAGLVAQDEFDRGARAVLNYGHTLGHALETVTGYSGEYLHGEAVSIGMVYAALVAESLGLAESGLADRHRKALARFGLPVSPLPPAPPFARVLEVIRQDKKSSGEVTMVLLEREGVPVVREVVDEAVLAGCYDMLGGG